MLPETKNRKQKLHIKKLFSSFAYFTVSLWIVIIAAVANNTGSLQMVASADPEADLIDNDILGIRTMRRNLNNTRSRALQITPSPVPTAFPTITSVPTNTSVPTQAFPTPSVSIPTKIATIKPTSKPVATPKVTPPLATVPDLNKKITSLSFAGQTWYPEDSGSQIWGPGENYWSPKAKGMYVDSNGYLNLKLWKEGNIWYCPGLISKNAMGYGTYTFTVDAKALNLDPNVVFGAFVYDDRPANIDSGNAYHREIDMLEITRWNNMSYPNGNFTVFNSAPSNTREFAYEINNWYSELTYTMIWSPGRVEFIGTPAQGKSENMRWVYVGDVPNPGQAKFMFNLWLFQSSAPKSNSEQQVIIKNFKYTPS